MFLVDRRMSGSILEIKFVDTSELEMICMKALSSSQRYQKPAAICEELADNMCFGGGVMIQNRADRMSKELFLSIFAGS